MEEKDIDLMLLNVATGQASEQELEQLDQWLAADPRNEESARQRLVTYNRVALAAHRAKSTTNRKKRIWSCAAAAAVAIIAVGLLMPSKEETQTVELQIHPGTTTAMLIVGDREIGLSEQTHIDIKPGGVSVNGEISTSAVQNHRVVVPRGGEYSLTLADGTRVRLNSESELNFRSGERHVAIKGEAFFDVAHDAQRPFTVTTSGGEIRVLGTRFNVSDYADQPLSAVLVEGGVGLQSNSGAQVTLAPRQRVVVDRNTGAMQVDEVNPSQLTAWTREMFIFHGQTLGEIATTLSRWYDVDIEVPSAELAGLQLSGQLSRRQDVRVLLDAYRDIAGIDYRVEGRTIILFKNN